MPAANLVRLIRGDFAFMRRPCSLSERTRRVTQPDALGAIASSPFWLPFDLDPGTDRVDLLGLDEAAYRQASFLDQRAIPPGAATRPAQWSDLAAHFPDTARRDVQYIFHIGNVGSTLISRLLGELPGCFALREPLLLRTFAAMLQPGRWDGAEGRERVDLLTRFLSRTWRPDQRALVKATSFTSEIAAQLVPTGSRALFLFATPAHYLENILAGPNSLQTLDILGPSRLLRLQRRCSGFEVDLGSLPPARKAALAWACEMSSLEANAAALPDGTICWVDFDLFLRDPLGHFLRIAGHFGPEAAPELARQICAGPLMNRYSKALEYEFSPADRQQILAEARWTHGSAIRDALHWLHGLGALYPAIFQALKRAQGSA